MNVFPKNIETYVIVIKNNETSEYYYQYAKSSWESFGLKLNRFDAVIPENLKNLNQIKFGKYSTAIKYVEKNIKKIITNTEKACFYNHYLLWEKCYMKINLFLY